MFKFFAMVVRFIKSLFLPKVSRVEQVVPRARHGTRTNQTWQNIVSGLNTRYNGILMSKQYIGKESGFVVDGKSAMRTYKLQAINATMVAVENGSVDVIDNETGHDVTEMVIASVMA